MVLDTDHVLRQLDDVVRCGRGRDPRVVPWGKALAQPLLVEATAKGAKERAFGGHYFEAKVFGHRGVDRARCGGGLTPAGVPPCSSGFPW